MKYVAAVAALTLVYALALASFHPLDLLFGAGLSAALVLASRRFVFGKDGAGSRPAGRRRGLLGRVVAFAPLAAVVVRDIVVGTWGITLITLGLRPLARSGIVAVPVGERTPMGVTVWAIITGLPPGTFFVDVDRERGVALIHVVDLRDPDAFREQQAELYRRYQSKVFP